MSCSKRKSPSNGKPEFRLPTKASSSTKAVARAFSWTDKWQSKLLRHLLPAHDAQVLTYLRMSGLRLGLLFKFHARLLQDGLRRCVV